ncbi:alpha-galactosidase [Microbacterium endophyticum]|uniref:Alpha-galactosidase n=1 Tax=Microbacterium endophyticum TaxID=1526412 RepID=A0A7W4YND3_9MICO|nr:glycoside hydrolase family 36 protein [Microbacterium endophyticum]MBB2975566.1 alpha-galactosidase [Microbacterium endophyticum]NIK35415.1 alpha-galactosidase [Microbacterium endophyticum]
MTTKTTAAETADRLVWGDSGFAVILEWDAETPVHVAGYVLDSREIAVHRVPVIEVNSVTGGHQPASSRIAHTTLGTQFRYVSHSEGISKSGRPELRICQRAGQIRSELRLESYAVTRTVRSCVAVQNDSERPLALMSVASWNAGFTRMADGADPLDGWQLLRGKSDWLGEGRWARNALRGIDFPRLSEHLTGHNPRGSLTATSQGTWSTGHHLPTAAIVSAEAQLGFAWQIEHNGAWRWEVGEDTSGGYLALSGPTDADSSWLHVLGPDQEFVSVPVAITVGVDGDALLAQLTGYRRELRRIHVDNKRMPVVFNDYMNTLDGDPTTEKLLPLIAAAAESGCEVFCIDAGWYDESGDWWDSVGEWKPSESRFPGGLREVIDAILAAGMAPGLWLEPEVVGIRSPLADTLPTEAFLQRRGVRVVEHDRFHLDFRHPAAVAHLDAVVDRLIADFSVEFFKFDYNINPGVGTDLGADSPGDGLLQHNRAHLAWLDRLLDRHPDLIIENCSSGAMRMDYAMLSRMAMQSTSDQQDFVSYPPIAAAAPLSMVPEQAASWAYPQPDMNDEEIAFCLVTGLLGRYYVSGYLNRMSGPQRALVSEAIGMAKQLRQHIIVSTPYWPLGLPGWTDEWISLGLAADGHDLVSVWHRGGSSTSTELSLPHLAGRTVSVETIFPSHLPAWPTVWDATTGTLTVHASDTTIAARTFRLIVSPLGQ